MRLRDPIGSTGLVFAVVQFVLTYNSSRTFFLFDDVVALSPEIKEA
jgi:hypothetical protein